MRGLGIFCLMVGLAASASALETAAGAATVNSSQIGITAKVDAVNAITTASINQIFNCNKNGQLFNSVTSSCIGVDEPLAKKIAACTTTSQFYNQTTGKCQASAPDLTAQLDSTNAVLNKMIACNAAKQFYNPTSGGCSGSGGGTPVPDMNSCDNWPVGDKGVMLYCSPGKVLVGIQSFGIQTGAKKWDARFVCCSLKIQ